jgi:hypothetical protein
VVGSLQQLYGPMENLGYYSGWQQYVGTSQYIDTVVTTTVASQRGSGEVNTTSSEETVASQVNKVSCARQTSGGYYYYGSTTTPVGFADCESRGLFLPAR